MPKQKKTRSQSNFISRRQQDRQERQKSFRRLFIVITAAVIVVVLGVVGWSIWNYQFKPYDQTVVRINGVSYNMRGFINSLEAYYGKAPSDSTISTFADYVEQQIVRNQTIIQGAQALGIDVNRSAAEQQLKNAGLSPSKEVVDITLAQQILSEQVPLSQPQYDVKAMLLENEAAGQAALARVQGGESFASVANTTSKITDATILGGDMGWVTPREADLTVNSTALGGIIGSADNGTLGGPVYDGSIMKQYGWWVAKAVEQRNVEDSTTNSTVEQMHLNGVLVGNEQDAQDVIAKLSAGANITELAQQYSQSPYLATNGADIGWITKGQNPGDFGQVFNVPLGTPVGPFSENATPTKGGWWVYQIVNKDTNRALSQSQFRKLEQDFIDRCTAALKKTGEYDIKDLLTPEMKDFALNEVVKSLGKGAILIGTENLPEGEAGVPYTATLKAYGDTQNAVWSLTQGDLPGGLSLNTATGVISGTPKLGGGSGFTVRVDSKVHNDTKELVMKIRVPVQIQTTSLPDAQVGTFYIQNIKALVDTDNYTWSITSGSLPPGFELAPNSGTLQGTANTTGTYTFTAKLDDGLLSTSQQLSLTVSDNTTVSGNTTQ